MIEFWRNNILLPNYEIWEKTSQKKQTTQSMYPFTLKSYNVNNPADGWNRKFEEFSHTVQK